MKLTQRQLDKISAAASTVKLQIEDVKGRLNGQPVYVGEELVDVFAVAATIDAPTRKAKQLYRALAAAEGALQRAEQLAEEIEFWADDAEPT